MNILDLSGSPKTFATHRRAMNRQGLDIGGTGGSPKSPSKSSLAIKHYSPKSNWRLNSPRTNVISTAIPEASNEDENIRDSLEKLEKLEITEANDKFKKDPLKHIQMEKRSPLPQIKENTVIEDNINIRDNIFLKTEENNFMKHELQTKGIHSTSGFAASGITRAQYMQLQKAQFLETVGKSSTPTSLNSSLASSNSSSTTSVVALSEAQTSSVKPPTVIDAIEKKRSQSPSLETAL